METVEVSAKTVEEAVQRALEKLEVSREEVEVTIIREGKSGVLGFGAEEATVRVRRLMPKLKKTDIAETVKGVVETLLAKLGLEASIEPYIPPFSEEGDEATAPVAFNIKGEDLGILIGRWGQTLTCLQYVVRLIIASQTKSWQPIVLDVEGYKQRRCETLQALARRIAEQVKVRGTPFTLRPMPAFERRIIHLTLADHPDVTTQSTGLGEARRVAILPREK
jgi:spoIIIJ-associated protein